MLFTTFSSSSSRNMSSSASNHNPSTKCDNTDTELSSNSDDGKNDSPNTSMKTMKQANSYQRQTPLLTEAILQQHEFYYPPMCTMDRIEYWNITGEFSDLEDDFDYATYYSKPVRSERVCDVTINF